MQKQASRKVPKVSIGLPVYNGEAHLRQALDSILAQTFTDFELIISDNASSDGTQEICLEYANRDPRIRYVRANENIGAARNFNRVLELARGTYWRWAAHDDVIQPTLLEKSVALLDTAPAEVVMAIPRRRMIPYEWEPGMEVDEGETSPSFHRVSYAEVLRLPGPFCPIFDFGLMRIDALRKTRLQGSYFGADLVLIAEMRLLGEIWEIPDDEPLFLQRVHSPDAEWRKTKRGEAVYLDPANKDRILMPGVKLLIEQVRAIRRSPIGIVRKLPRYRDLFVYIFMKYARFLLPWSLARRLTQEIRWSVEKAPREALEAQNVVSATGARQSS